MKPFLNKKEKVMHNITKRNKNAIPKKENSNKKFKINIIPTKRFKGFGGCHQTEKNCRLQSDYCHTKNNNDKE